MSMVEPLFCSVRVCAQSVWTQYYILFIDVLFEAFSEVWIRLETYYLLEFFCQWPGPFPNVGTYVYGIPPTLDKIKTISPL